MLKDKCVEKNLCSLRNDALKVEKQAVQRGFARSSIDILAAAFRGLVDFNSLAFRFF